MTRASSVPFIEQRPPRRITDASAIERAETRLKRRLHYHVKKLEELAKGVVVAEPARRKGYDVILRDPTDGSERLVGQNLTLYSTPPNLQALQYLTERAMGKVPSQLEVTGDAGGPLEVIPWMPAAVAQLEEYIEGDAKLLEEEDESGA